MAVHLTMGCSLLLLVAMFFSTAVESIPVVNSSRCNDQLASDCRVYGNSKCYRSGSTQPASSGQYNITLYSMRFCPYSERARLILNAKNTRYNIINIDPYNQPAWFAGINPKKQVPSLELENGTRIHGSLDISVYVNENFPGIRYEHDLAKDYIITFVTENISKSMKILTNRTIPVNASLVDHLIDSMFKLDGMLDELRTEYFNGAVFGMTDLMIWPWFERSSAVFKRPEIERVLDKNMAENKYRNGLLPQNLVNWHRKMSEEGVVSITKYGELAHERNYETHDCDSGLCDCHD
ncbi:glutathione S-transferase omega-1-like [Paramacrobiotus metropolitanus]|uniref:glutathione S-transferase omega-1-like n=1 Tax=Paramacrobiotus metropolitanus TaxID=2943436 RepID=UPI0024460AAA|nr:glutathione S-transferase omega-1-like [Paramacrobiotus metropolitanus]